jgi:hypothetical protein
LSALPLGSHLVPTFPSFTVWPERSRTSYRHSLSDDTSGASSRNAGYAWRLPPSALLRHPLPEPSSRSHEEAASAEKGCSLIYSPARNTFGSVMRRRIENSYWRGEKGWMGAKRGGEDSRTATPDFSDMSIALVCMVALGDGVQGVWRWIWSSRFSAWTRLRRERGSWKEAFC